MCACAGFLLVAVFPAIVGMGARAEVVALAGETAGGGAGPRFAARQPAVVRGVVGGSVTLECRVLNLGDKSVLWVRSRDLQILSHGGAVFTADARVSVPAGAAHALRIDRLRVADAGRYECQLNTEPKMSRLVHLTVLDEAEAESEVTTEPLPDRASAWDAGEVRVWALAAAVRGAVGGAAELGCAARRTRPPPAAALPLDIRWLHDGKPLTIQGAGGGAVWRSGGAAAAESRLRLEALRPQDAGQYSCAAGVSAASVLLTLDGDGSDSGNRDDMEAMQRDQSSRGAGLALSAPLALAAALLARLAVP